MSCYYAPGIRFIDPRTGRIYQRIQNYRCETECRSIREECRVVTGHKNHYGSDDNQEQRDIDAIHARIKQGLADILRSHEEQMNIFLKRVLDANEVIEQQLETIKNGMEGERGPLGPDSSLGNVLTLQFRLGDGIRVDAPNGISTTGTYISSADNYLVWKGQTLPGVSWQDLTSVSVTKI